MVNHRCLCVGRLHAICAAPQTATVTSRRCASLFLATLQWACPLRSCEQTYERDVVNGGFTFGTAIIRG